MNFRLFTLETELLLLAFNRYCQNKIFGIFHFKFNIANVGSLKHELPGLQSHFVSSSNKSVESIEDSSV